MQTSDARDTPTPAPQDGADGDPAPGVDTLLRLSAQGDRDAFSAFYDATVPWIHGMATAMFRSPQDAAEATAQTYLTAWEEAPEAEMDLSAKDDAPDRERQVVAWLTVLAHRVMAGLLRSDSHPEHGRHLLPDRAGHGDAGPSVMPADLVGQVDPTPFEAVRLSWLGGMADTDVAARLRLPVDLTRTLLRDGMQQIIAAHRDALGLSQGRTGREDAARPALGRSVREDVEAGNGAELADLSALHALDTAGHTAATAAAERRGAGELALWRSRVEGGRRALTWAFRDVVAQPPAALLDEIHARLPAQDVGMDLVEEHAGPRTPTADRRPLKTMLLALLAVLVLAIGAWVVWSQFTGPGIQHRVDTAEDNYTTSEYPADGGGTLQGFLSRDENAGYVTVSGMPQLADGEAYQVWLYPTDGSAPASLGTFGPNDFRDPITFRGLSRFAALGVTVEPSGGSDVPTTESLSAVDLDPTSDSGPQYGGRPSGQ